MVGSRAVSIAYRFRRVKESPTFYMPGFFRRGTWARLLVDLKLNFTRYWDRNMIAQCNASDILCTSIYAMGTYSTIHRQICSTAMPYRFV